MITSYLLVIKAARCERVLELISFSRMKGVLLVLKKSVCIQVHSSAFLAHTSDFVGDNCVKDSIVLIFAPVQLFPWKD